jgi:predicted permease
VVAFVLGVVAAVTLALASAPALRALRADPAAVLRAGGRGARGSRAGSRLRRGLVVGQIALALILLAGLGIAGRGFTALVGADPGFDPRGVLALTFELPETPGEAEPAAEFYRDLEDRLRALPGVSAAGFTNGLPLEGTVWSASFELVSPDPEVGDVEPGANMRAVSPGYFDAMGMRVLAGRGFDVDERAGRSAPVVVIDQTLARRYWPGGSPLGRRVLAGALSADEATIVGVVADVPDQGLHAPSSGHLYLPMFQRPLRRATAVLRTDGDPQALAPAARAAVRAADPRVPVFDVRTLDDRLAAELAGPRLAVLILAGFGALALILATLGVYGVLAHATSLRRGEIGTRIALGARPAAVARGVLLEGLGLWALGTLLGGAGAAWAAGSLVRVLPTAPPADAVTLAAAGVALGLASLVAAWVPAWRAARLDPAEALRRE